MRYFVFAFLLLFNNLQLASQDTKSSLSKAEKEKALLLAKLSEIDNELEELKFQKIISDLKAIGLPSDNYIEHSAMILEYAEAHEQAKWVAHIILPEIEDGNILRSNDFRSDPKVTTGTAVQTDYFLTDTISADDITHDGFGYDRGHLAPSADFRWSEQALSESYFYSNMSPQLASFNRKSWAQLENHLRQYVLIHKSPLYVVTAPILSEDLAKIPRATNHVSVPEQFIKAVYDPVNKTGIGFIMPNKTNEYSLKHYAVSIDKVEEVLGLNVFQSLDESIEKDLDKKHWFAELDNGEVEPINQPSMPPAHFNTIVAQTKVGRKVKVCGKVVSAKYLKGGKLVMNLDKKFPNHIFSVFIKKENLANFDSDIKPICENKLICVEGKVLKYNDNISMNIKDTNDISFYKPKSNLHQEED